MRLVVDIFAGSNTTGAASERLGRKWIAFELEQKYLAASAFRFMGEMDDKELVSLYDQLCVNSSAEVFLPQQCHEQLSLFNTKRGRITIERRTGVDTP